MDKGVLENHQRYLERKKLYESFGYDVDRERKFILGKTLPIYGHILEVGTGKGYFALTLAEEGYKFTSVDVSEEEQDTAKLNLRYYNLERFVDFRIENAERLSFKNRSFDLVFSVNTIHHLTDPFKIVNELIRVTNFYGRIILSDFTEEGFKLVDEIHKTEGGKHEAGSVGLKSIGDYLTGRKLEVESCKSRFQEVIIARRVVI
ncbi:MAG: class I SAM-dependent methyltransferase [Candidatus Omnitrophica bacterium]|nr:class I SAM-dependent methyltransferase [Candidatus Omnitrophota bacterium]